MKDSLNKFLDGVEHLPPSPRILVKLLDLFKQPDQSIDEIVKLIGHDPSFTAEVLRRCNTVHFGANQPAGDIAEAVTRLGFQEVYNVVLGMFASEAILRPGYSPHVEILWRHSVAVAVASGVLAQAVDESVPFAFTAGLLHEVGKVIMVSSDAGRYAQAVQDAAMFKRSTLVTENQLFGFDHTELGACLLERWNLPPSIVAAVRHHHQLAGSEPFERLAATIHLANILAHATAEKFTYTPKSLETPNESMTLLQLTPETVAGLLPAMVEGLKKARALTPS